MRGAAASRLGSRIALQSGDSVWIQVFLNGGHQTQTIG